MDPGPPPTWLIYATITELDVIAFACGLALERYDGTLRMKAVNAMEGHVQAEITRRGFDPALWAARGLDS